MEVVSIEPADHGPALAVVVDMESSLDSPIEEVQLVRYIVRPQVLPDLADARNLTLEILSPAADTEIAPGDLIRFEGLTLSLTPLSGSNGRPGRFDVRFLGAGPTRA
jgi:hypothetical protein